MASSPVLCLGELLIDRLADQPGLSLNDVHSWTSYPGGAPANVACGLTKLGTPVNFISCVGSDVLGTALVEFLKTVGLDCAGVQLHPTAPTRQVYVVRTDLGERQFAGFSQPDTTLFADTRLQADLLPLNLFAGVKFLVIGTLGLACPETAAAIQRALEIAQTQFIQVVVDVNWRPMFWPNPSLAPGVIHDLLRQVDFLKLSIEEAEWLFDTSDPEKIGHQLGTVKGILVTAGEQGCAYSFSGHQGRLPAFSVDTEDTTGAGDAFLAGFIHQLCHRGAECLQNPALIREILTYAGAVGALTTTRTGAIAAQPSAKEVEAFLYLQQHSPFS
ncbi:MAG: carbohydrate kinase [Leptolyngbyaceae cyanobacterium MO_188.B28]|nr:carbohydrate kinase [Leptolyngbyaceae cyanobacterium MO_188.B28]